ncbi:MAG: hypothetical protein ACYCPW_00345 [Nitrososphaerales archaeon]
MYPRVKEIASKQYIYLVEGVRQGSKVRQSTVAYLGPLSVLTFGIPSTVRKKAERRARVQIDWETVEKQIAKIPVKFEALVNSRRREVSLRARAQFKKSPPSNIISANISATPKELLLQRAPGELEALAQLSKRGFDSMFQQIGPYEYKLRRTKE